MAEMLGLGGLGVKRNVYRNVDCLVSSAERQRFARYMAEGTSAAADAATENFGSSTLPRRGNYLTRYRGEPPTTRARPDGRLGRVRPIFYILC
jgi:hypothetical protein